MGVFEKEAILRSAEDQASRLGRSLDYSDGSIEVLEGILELYARYFRENGPDDQKIWNQAVLYGTYLGETLLRNGLADLGYRWALTENSLPVLAKDGRNQMSPITKAEKRIQNGPEDSVKSFYDVAKVIAQGKLIPGRRTGGPGAEEESR